MPGRAGAGEGPPCQPGGPDHLALALAVAGAQIGRTLPANCAVMGEVGLGGELRSISMPGLRLAEAVRMGYKQILCPPLPSDAQRPKGCELIEVTHIQQALLRLE